MMGVYRVIISYCSLLVCLCQYGDTASTVTPQVRGTPGPFFHTFGSLIGCARSCYAKPNCSTLMYGKVDEPGYDCGYETDPKAAKGIDARNVTFFTMIRDKSEKVDGNSYVQLDSTTPTFSLSASNESVYLVGNNDSRQLLKITTTIQCKGCSGKHIVSIYNVRENTKDPIPSNDQPEGTAVCQEATPTKITSVFLAANGSYALIRIGRGSTATGSIKGKVTFSMENWGTSYSCRDCTVLKTLPNTCKPEAVPIFKRFMDFHVITAPTVPPTLSNSGNSGTRKIIIPEIHSGSDRTKRAINVSKATQAIEMSPRPFTQLVVSNTEPTKTTESPTFKHDGNGGKDPGNNNNNNIPEIPSGSDRTKGPADVSKTTPKTTQGNKLSPSPLTQLVTRSSTGAVTNTTRRNKHRGSDDNEEDETTSVSTKVTTPKTDSVSKWTHLPTPVTSLSDSSSTRKQTTPKSRSDRDKDNDNKNDDDNKTEDNKNENDKNNNNNNNNNNNGNSGNQAGQQTSSSGGSSAGSGVIGGAVGGVLAAVAVLAGVGAVLYRRHKKNKVEPSEVEIDLEDHVPGSVPPCHHDSNALLVRQAQTQPLQPSSSSSSPPPPTPLPPSLPPPPPSTTKADEEC